MKKYKLLSILLISLAPIHFVNASNVSATISVSKDSIVKGNSGTSTLTIQSDGRISITEGTFDCGSLGNIDLSWSAQSLDQTQSSKSFQIKWDAKNIGTHTCSVTGLKVGLATDPGAGMMSVTASSKTITVIGETTNNKSNNTSGNSSTNSNKKNGTTAEKKEYDSDNSLKSLEIENYQITPNFNKDTTEYKLEVDESVEKINIKATTTSSKAEISGVGEKNLTQGENTIEVKVTAENGNEKVYKIIVTVKDQHPIEVKVDDKKYTIVKKNNNILDKLENYEEEIIKINDQDVISYINKKTKVRLIILKDENNKVAYYVYNEQTKKYNKYKTITIGKITLQLLDAPTSLKYYKKYPINIKDETVDIYKIKKSHKAGLIYGTNIKTGNTGYYVYDETEETLSKYYNEEVKKVKKELLNFKNEAMIFMGVVSGIVILSIIISICKSIKRNKRR